MGSDDAGVDGIFEIVADVGNAICPTHHFAFGSVGGRSAPGVIADAIEGFLAQIESGQGDVGSPGGMVEAARHQWTQGVFAGMTAGSVSAIVAEGNGIGEGHV